MMYKQFQPNMLLFSSIMLLSTSILMTTTNWMMMWAMLETNLMSIIPLLMKSKKSYELESGLKYFIIQAVSSFFFLLSISLFMSSSYVTLASWTFLLSVLTKMGSAPCHFWVPPVMSNTSWMMLFTLSTWQKIPPLWLLANLSYLQSNFSFNMIITLNALIGAVGGINQTQTRPLLAYSSITHSAWLISSLPSSSLTITYFAVYSVLLFILTSSFLKTDLTYTNNFMSTQPPQNTLQPISYLHLLSLAGLPPLLGFLPKWMILKSLSHYSLMIPSILVLATLLSLFYYLNIYIASQHTMKSPNTKEPSPPSVYLASIMLVPMFLLFSTT